MNKNKLLFLSFALLAIFVAPFQASAQTTAVSAGTATRISGQNDDFFKNPKNCSVVKVVDSDADDVHTLDLQPQHQGLPLVRFTKNISLGSAITYYACTAEAFAIIQTTYNPGVLNSLSDTLVSFFTYFISIVNGFLTWVLKWAGYLLIAMIGQGKFITSDIVTQAWPFVQGLANLGFIFALLYIALATTLRLESVSSSIQRLLPRLLIAALLVNFSLVIGGLIIDASRLVMAAEIKIMGGGSLDYENFTAKLVESSNASATILSDIPIVDTSNASAAVLKMIQSVVFLGLLTAAIFVIAINLFIRYIALLILLILSPMAYLALALPKTSQYATQWWGMFIKWVLYGPIVLFFLIIITRIQNVDIVLSDTIAGNRLFTVFFNQFIHFAIVIALFFAAHSVGKKVAGAGSDAVMGFAKKNPRAALLTGLALGTGGLAAPLAAVGLNAAARSRTANDLYKGVGSNLKESKMVKPVRKFFGAGNRNEKGELKAGKSSWTSNLAETLTGGLNQSKNEDRAKVASNIDTTLLNPIKDLEHESITPTMLSRGHVVQAMDKGSIGDLMTRGEQSQRMAIAGNKDYIAGLNPGDLNELQTFVRKQMPSGTDREKREKTQVLDRILKTVQEKDKA